MAEIKKKQESPLASLQNLFTNGLQKQGESEDSGAVNTSNPEVSPALNTSAKQYQDYFLMKQGNILAFIESISNKNGEGKYNRADNTYRIKQGDGTLIIPCKFGTCEFTCYDTSTLLFLDVINVVSTLTGAFDNDNPEISLPLRYFMELRNLKSIKETRKQVREALDALINYKIIFRDTRRGKKHQYARISVLDGDSELSNGIIKVTWGWSFFKILKDYPFAYYPQESFQTRGGNRNYWYYFNKTIIRHGRMNVGKKNELRISVATFLKECPIFPRYEDIMNSGRQVEQRLIEPFEKTLNKFLYLGIRWDYYHLRGKKLTKEEIDHLTYDVFIKLIIAIEREYYPDMSSIPIKREEHKKKLEQAKARRERKTITELNEETKKLNEETKANVAELERVKGEVTKLLKRG